MADYSIVWCRSSYRKSRDGFLTHAAEDDPEPGVWASPKALCGVRWTDSGWGEVGKDGSVGCARCRAALKKIEQAASQGVDRKGAGETPAGQQPKDNYDTY